MIRVLHRCRRPLPIIAIAVVAVWTVLPVLRFAGTSLPIRSNLLTTVPVFNAWTIWWNADRFLHGFSGYWDAPIFFPADNAFAFSEPQPATLIVAPIVWLTGSPASAYNAYLLLSLFLNGIVSFMILRRHGVSRSLATIGGVMMVWLPISLRQLDVLQLIPVWPLLWVWDVLTRHGRAPSRRTGLEFAIAFSFSFYTCVHQTLLLSVVLIATVWILLAAIRSPRFWSMSLLAIASVAIPVAVVLVPMRQTLTDNNFKRSEKTVTRLSARASDLFLLPKDAPLRGGGSKRFGLSPGWLKFVLAGCGIAWGVRRRKHRRWVFFLAATVLVSGLLALGPRLKIGEFQPWWTVAEWCPGLRQVRSVFRFTYLAQMAIILLSVIGLWELWLRLRIRTRRAMLASSVIAVLGVLAIAEVPAPQPLVAGVPDLNRHAGWTGFVKENTPDGKSIACLPFSPGTKAANFSVTSRWMYMGTLHGVPLVNGYSGFFPKAYMNLRRQITNDGLTAESLAQLAQMKVHFLVVRRGYTMPQSAGENGRSHALRLVLEDPVGVDVYELVRFDDGYSVSR
ncbi:MAG: hypothetical protein GY758_35090 [Fuerstiella sp.]|nr:hypothetical protein [Fuerstiella sp.]